METLTIRNPANGDLVKTIPCSSSQSIPQVMERARKSQKIWGETPLEIRIQKLLDLRERMIQDRHDLAKTIVHENGKPEFEALTNEIFPTVELISYFATQTKKTLRPFSIPMRLMQHRKSTLHYQPLGTVLIISPWNYPFLLPMGEIVMAIATGNSVVFKPSEITPLIGLRIEKLFQDSGFPEHIIQTVIGDGKTGADLIAGKPDKIFFTGSVPTGRKILKSAAEHLIPVNLELGGKDAMIVCDDADIDHATSAALWGGFSNSGQICASVERILVHESVRDEFVREFKRKIETLRQGDPTRSSVDVGAITMEKQRLVYESQIQDAERRGLKFETGGKFSSDRRFLEPTLVVGNDIENSTIYQEETFGPVIALSTFSTDAEAIQKSNHSAYGLLGSVFSRDLKRAEKIALALEVGTVTINEVVYTAGLPETPWGGRKESGYGKKHSAHGLFEFVHTKHIHEPRWSGLQFKSLWWYPYTPLQARFFDSLFGLYQRDYLAKLASLPTILRNLITFISKEPRI